MTDFQVARRAMIDSQLRPQGVTNTAVLAAMAGVPREDHVPESARAFAYFDRSIPLGDGRAMMPPAAIGRLLDALDPKPGERALVVAGAGGYAAALLEAIGCSADSIDAGASPSGSYDLILVDGAIEELPAAFAGALAPHGRLGTALLDRGVARLAIATVAGGALAFRTFADADVAPLAAYQRPRAFTF
ncbi:protein-L-isoaspartate O-methyltransferase [Sphingomonas rhizophila]|uniref:Protein-L-isoaspartate O-methyltransferase n=1 Tax=Sphingomonas rhizophila TaxID=2071607 RepID=A0A7G9SC89_9SPHN|nr:protein-L-isoaspartate O-methyltransferase [Sphingomonas rhizophila]QNN65464.1 protein-L-isoaspartate O-methyltransferase [Sphingomonas rhizophila]